MNTNPVPRFAFELWASGLGDIYCATDREFPMHSLRRLWWRVRGAMLMFAFGWWDWR
jgi:hypothetical protein